MHFNQFKIGLTFTALLMTGTSGYGAVAQICDSVTCQSLTYFDQQSVLAKLTEMFQNNTNQILLCQANPESRKCLVQPLTFNGQTTLMNVDFQVPFMRILQKERLKDGLSLSLDYQIRANEKYPKCAASVSPFTLSPKGEISFNSPRFECHATELGETFLEFQFNVDYVNFETGWIGANYEAISSGDVVGDGTGYVMMKISAERSIPLKHLQPSYDDYRDRQPQFNHESGKLVDWDKESIKTKWNSFKEKFLKILYLEPIE